MKEIERLQSLYREQAQPGPEHKMLEKMAGAWSQDIRLWPEPGAEPMITKGTIEWELLLGGRFLQGYSRLDGSDEVTGVSLLGFDRRSGRYTCLGMDAVGTYWVSAEGAPGADGEPIVMAGRDDNPSLNHTQIYDFVLRWLDDNTYVFEIIFKDEIHTRGTGIPFKKVELTARRQR